MSDLETYFDIISLLIIAINYIINAFEIVSFIDLGDVPQAFHITNIIYICALAIYTCYSQFLKRRVNNCIEEYALNNVHKNVEQFSKDKLISILRQRDLEIEQLHVKLQSRNNENEMIRKKYKQLAGKTQIENSYFEETYPLIVRRRNIS